MEIMDSIRQRHSVRQYTGKKIEEEKRQILKKLIQECNVKGNLNIQMLSWQ